MVVKVLKPGVLPETKQIATLCVCTYCKCEFEFAPIDAVFEHDQRDGNYYRIECPTCSRECTMSTELVK